MNIPKFWAKAEGDVQIDSQQFRFIAWEGSDVSREDARVRAEQSLQSRIARKQRGEPLRSYPKGGAPLREEIVDEVFSDQDDRIAIVTRNSAGCLVLNTAHAMFIDMDFPNAFFLHQAAGIIKGLFQAVAGLFNPSVREKPKSVEERSLDYCRTWHEAHQDWSIRIYRTKRGLRLLVTNQLFDPMADEVQKTMEALGADNRYVRMCRSQSCFRARLTPKPWRIGLKRPRFRFPWENLQAEQDQRAWENLYNKRASQFAVCKLVATLGNQVVHDAIAPIVSVHDGLVLGEPSLPLA